jgi:uridylate kinase
MAHTKKEEVIVMSVGGSLLVPNEVDSLFLRDFLKLIQSEIKKGRRFILITGGGKVCRQYQGALKEVVNSVSVTELDWLGIAVTHLNARLVQLAFGKLAHSAIATDATKRTNFKEKVLVAGGWKPGRSTDDDAVRLAKIYGAKTVINLSNVDYIYDSDPRTHSDAKKIERLSWAQYRRMFGSKWSPGAHVPFDPVASKLAQQNKATVVFLNGANLANVKSYLDGGPFVGSVIE